MNELPPKVPIPKEGSFFVSSEISDVSTSARKYLHTHYKKEIKIAIIFGAVFEIIFIYIFLSRFIAGKLDDPRVVFILFTPILVYAVALARAIKELRHEFYKQFAAVNGYAYSQKGWLPDRSGAMFLVGHSKFMEDIIEGKVGNLPFNLFNYTYTVGHGKHSTTYSRTVWEIDFGMALPSMMLLLDYDHFGDDLSDNTLKLPSRINLGELERHYTLFSEKKFEIEALQIFSPGFLQELHEKYPDFSLDFSGSSLFIYCRSVITTKEKLLALKDLVDFITQRLGTQLPFMRGSIDAMHEALTKAPNSVFSIVNFKRATGFNQPEVILLIAAAVFFIIMFSLLLIYS